MPHFQCRNSSTGGVVCLDSLTCCSLGYNSQLTAISKMRRRQTDGEYVRQLEITINSASKNQHNEYLKMYSLTLTLFIIGMSQACVQKQSWTEANMTPALWGKIFQFRFQFALGTLQNHQRNITVIINSSTSWMTDVYLFRSSMCQLGTT